MKKYFNLFLVFFVLSSLLLLANELPPTNADGELVVFNRRGCVTAILGCTSDTQKECREASYVLDSFRGRNDFRLIVIVDLRDSFGGFFKDYVRERMRSDLDLEAKRLKPFYLKNGNPNNPRFDLCAVPDFSGNICKSLEWIKSLHGLHAIIFGRDGKEITRWDNLQNYRELQSTVAHELHEK